MKARGLPLLISLILGIGTLAVFIPVAKYEFVNYDDHDYVSSNSHVQGGLKWENVVWAFNGGHASNWHPLTWLSHMADWEMFGARAGGHHLINALIHLVNSILLFHLLRYLTGALWRSALVAALFAWHPLHVESVAWVSERKDVLSTCFFMLTLWAYARYVNAKVSMKQAPGLRLSPPVIRLYVLCMVLYILGLLCKPMLVTVPFVFLLLDFWPLRRGVEFNTIQIEKWKRLFIEKLPFFILAGISSVVTFIVQRKGGSVWSVAEVSIGSRLQNSVVAYCRYLGKLFWPTELSVFYPHPGFWPVLVVIAACAVLVAVSFIVLHFRRFQYLPVGWFWYVGTLVPVIGIVQVGWQSIADRYTYIPYIGIFVLLVWFVEELTRDWRARAIPLAVVSGVGLVILGVLTRQQVGYWKDSETLFSHALAVTTNNFVAHHNLGLTLVQQGRTDEAIRHFAAAVRLRPKYADSYNGLGEALLRQGRVDEAKQMFDKAVSLSPNLAVARNNLGIALSRKGFVDQAIGEFEAALKAKPDYAKACNNLGMAYQSQGRLDEAIVQLQEAVRLAPSDAEARNNLGMALGRKGRIEEAVVQLQQAIALDPKDSQSRHNLGLAFSRLGRVDEAILSLMEALKLKPDSPETHAMLGSALARKGRREEAVGQFKIALKLRPVYPEAEQQLRELTR